MGGKVIVVIGRNGRLKLVENYFIPGLNFTAKPQISIEDAVKKVESFGTSGTIKTEYKNQTFVKIIWHNDQLEVYLAYLINIETQSWLVSAFDGGLVSLSNLLMAHEHYTEKEFLWREFKARYPSNYSWQVEWHGNRDSPYWISGSYTLVTEIKDKSDAEAIAIDIITDSKDLLKISDVSDLKLRRTMEDKWTFIPEYDQYYKSIPVYGGEVRVILNKNNVFSGVTNTFYPNINISTTPVITKEEAVEIAKTNVGATLTENQIIEVINSTQLLIFPKNNEYFLVWKVPITYYPYYDVFVNAVDGSIVQKFRNVVETTASPGTTGSTKEDREKWLYVAIPVAILILLFFWRRRK